MRDKKKNNSLTNCERHVGGLKSNAELAVKPTQVWVCVSIENLDNFLNSPIKISKERERERKKNKKSETRTRKQTKS